MTGEDQERSGRSITSQNFPEVLKKTTRNLFHNSLLPDQGSNSGLYEYEAVLCGVRNWGTVTASQVNVTWRR